MPKSILAVGLQLASDAVKTCEFSSRSSLLDADIVLFRPNIGEMYLPPLKWFQGKVSLDESESFQLREAVAHWRREIMELVESGKNVFVFLTDFEEVYAATGSKEYSGTGRNRQTTTHVSPITNVSCLPISAKFIDTRGSIMILSQHGVEFLKEYWREFGSKSEYKMLLEGEGFVPCIVTKSGQKPVGAIVRAKKSTGALVLLPDVDFEDQRFVTKTGNWSVEGTRFAERFISQVVAMDATLLSSEAATPAPQWVTEQAYRLHGEAELLDELNRISSRMEALSQKRSDVESRYQEAGRLRGLLYETGKRLEQSIIDALTLLGFAAARYSDGASEFDVVFESEEGRLIGEAEGKDSKPIAIEKLRQLAMNLHEDATKTDAQGLAKGVLFGNAHRLLPPAQRQEFFTEKCRNMAVSTSVALVRTTSLFNVAQYLGDVDDPDFRRECRLAMLEQSGEVVFPSIPQKPDRDQESIVLSTGSSNSE
ncbi:MAG: hypothetical protein JWQ89_4412 [Devosia sp.]|uniref:hypothetical protein n=1 Tax=Devosia sp. TaxID=1871048 RepID=UPI0026096C95|nr:hypothetical protein [Devosia sp.]MDB5542685.1 hypothetical protein [Devosia sp.]